MTTIAWDGRYLVSDSLCCGRYKMADPEKKIFLFDEEECQIAIGFSGPVEDADYIMRRIVSKINSGGDYKIDGDWICLVVIINRNESGKLINYSVRQYDDDTRGHYEIKSHASVGSGCEYAIAVMDAGFDAMKSVEVACGRDFHTGGPLQIFDVLENRVYGPFAQRDLEIKGGCSNGN